MVVKTPQKVANLPAVARCGGNKKRLICMSLRAPTTIATSFIKIRKSSSYKSLSKLVAVVASRAHGHFHRSAHKKILCPSGAHLGLCNVRN
jgi:hypothetical protein